MSFAVNPNSSATYTPALSTSAAPDSTVVTTATGGSGFTGDVNQAGVFQETKLATSDLTFDTSKLAKEGGGVSPATMQRLEDLAHNHYRGAAVTLPSMQDASVRVTRDAATRDLIFHIDVKTQGFAGEVTETTDVSKKDLETGNFGEDVKDLLAGLLQDDIFIPNPTGTEERVRLPGTEEVLEQRLQQAMEDGVGSIELEGDVAFEPYSVSYGDGAYVFTPEAGQVHQPVTLTREQIAGREEIPSAEGRALRDKLKNTFGLGHG